jgi:type I restriction enzyme S subunit
MKTYPQYKDSGVPWMGRVPTNWDVKPLRTILKLRNEKNNPIKTTQVLSLSIARGVTLYSHEGRGGNKAKDDLTAYKIAQVGDIVLNSMNVVVGAVGLSKYTGAISPVYYALYPNEEKIDINFYDKVFSNKAFQRYLLIYGKGILIKKGDSGKLNTIRMKISPNDLKSTILPLPSKKEQISIARYLDWKTSKIIKFIKGKKKLIALLKEQKQNIINEAITKGANPDVKMKESGIEWIGKIPEHWEIRKLRHICTFQNGISESGDFFTDGTPFVSYGDVYKNRVLPSMVTGKAKADLAQQKAYSVKKGDIFFTRTSETIDEIGITSICFESIDLAVFSGFLIRARPTKAIISPDFSEYAFQATGVREYFSKEMNIVTRASLGQNLLKNLPVVLPPVEEQLEIAAFLRSESAIIDKTIARTEREIELIQEYRTRLVSDVVTGKVDVRSVKIPDFEPVEADLEVQDDEESEDELITEGIEE